MNVLPLTIVVFVSRRIIIGLLLMGCGLCPTYATGPVTHTLEYAPAPADNPLKGLVPYAHGRHDGFPHSLEFNYLPLSEIVTARDRYDWTALDRLLEKCAARGHQVVFRVYVEFPGRSDGIPRFLIEDGLRIHKYLDQDDHRSMENITPDYSDGRLRGVLRDFIAALGQRYDGDPRLGFITAGLLGKWGEWHTHPKTELFASKEVQLEVMDAYEAAFHITPILLRYPAAATSSVNAPNANRRFGYHDDSFAWATLDTGRKNDKWFFMTALRAAGPQALDKWKTRPIGGEIRPEAWGHVFDRQPGVTAVQDFRRCVEETHATWLMDSGMFTANVSPERWQRAEEEVRRMGYEFHVRAVTIGPTAEGQLRVAAELENRGVAPFYYDWLNEFSLIAGGKCVRIWKGTGKLSGLLPGEPARVWGEALDVHGIEAGVYQLAVRVPNTMPTGRPVRFANKTQDADAPGWLTLGEFRAP